MRCWLSPRRLQSMLPRTRQSWSQSCARTTSPRRPRRARGISRTMGSTCTTVRSSTTLRRVCWSRPPARSSRCSSRPRQPSPSCALTTSSSCTRRRRRARHASRKRGGHGAPNWVGDAGREACNYRDIRQCHIGCLHNTRCCACLLTLSVVSAADAAIGSVQVGNLEFVRHPLAAARSAALAGRQSWGRSRRQRRPARRCPMSRSAGR
mmetsp:Transcript_41120/g.104214  ORF Transcript_41120/g.104214 Transcript_41120/m.104214 type:complete len:208 (+) Transcript_41120:1520-2143(+)